MGCLGAGDLGGATSLVEILPPPSAPPFQTPSAIEPQCEHSQLRQVPPHIKALPDSILLGLAWDHPSAQIGSTRGTAPSKRNDLVTSRFKEFAQRREAMPRSDINTSLPVRLLVPPLTNREHPNPEHPLTIPDLQTKSQRLRLINKIAVQVEAIPSSSGVSGHIVAFSPTCRPTTTSLCLDRQEDGTLSATVNPLENSVDPFLKASATLVQRAASGARLVRNESHF